jgi:hypothetical protein
MVIANITIKSSSKEKPRLSPIMGFLPQADAISAGPRNGPNALKNNILDPGPASQPTERQILSLRADHARLGP